MPRSSKRCVHIPIVNRENLYVISKYVFKLDLIFHYGFIPICFFLFFLQEKKCPSWFTLKKRCVVVPRHGMQLLTLDLG